MYFWQSEGGNIAIDPSGQIWVADQGHGRFAIFQPDGTFVEYWGSSGRGDAQFHLSRPNGDAFGAVAFAPDGAFYVLDTGNLRVQHFDRERAYLGSWDGDGTSDGRFSSPVGIAVDSQGQVHVLDVGRDAMETYDAGGRLVASFAPHLGQRLPPYSVALDSSGNVYLDACCVGGDAVRQVCPGWNTLVGHRSASA